MNKTSSTLGYYAALIAFIAATGYVVVQLLQVAGVLKFPWDAVLIYGFSFCIAIPFLLAMLALHYAAPLDKKIWSHAALLLACLYATYACFVYVIQLATVIPQTVRGEAGKIQVLVMSEHSLFWTVDGMAYISMGLCTLFGAFVFTKEHSQTWVKRFFLANAFITPLVMIAYFYPHFSTALLFIGVPWIITAPGSMLLLALFFKRNLNNGNNKQTNQPKEPKQRYPLESTLVPTEESNYFATI